MDSGLELLGPLKENKSFLQLGAWCCQWGKPSPPSQPQPRRRCFSVLYFVLLLGDAVGNDCCSDFVSGDDFIEMLNPQQVLCNMTHGYVLEVITLH